METTVTTTAAEVIPAGPRKALIVQNAGSADILLAPRTNVAASGANAGLVLAPGESLALGALPGSAHNVAHAALHAVAASGSQALRWEEYDPNPEPTPDKVVVSGAGEANGEYFWDGMNWRQGDYWFELVSGPHFDFWELNGPDDQVSESGDATYAANPALATWPGSITVTFVPGT